MLLIFMVFSFTWIYDALTVTDDDCVSMFYLIQSRYYTQLYPRLLGILLPVILLLVIIAVWRFRLESIAIGLSLSTLEFMTLKAIHGTTYWSNPFHRNNVSPNRLDFILGAFLYLSVFLTLCYLVYNIVYYILCVYKKKGAPSC